MSDPQTIREHLEAIRDERDMPLNGAVFEEIVRYCEHITRHAVAALGLMDRCKFDVLSISESGDRSTLCRSVPDPEGHDARN